MSVIAHSRTFVVGVDTHARNHVYAVVVAVTGELADTRAFPTTGAGINRALAWVARQTNGDLNTLWVIEGVASYGAVLAGAIAAMGYQVVEAARMDARTHHGVGTSDELDSQRIAQAVLSLHEEDLRHPRLDQGIRASLRVLVAARHSVTTERTRAVNALTAIVRVHELGLDAR